MSSSAADLFASSSEGFFSFNDPFHDLRSRQNTKEPHLLQSNIVLAALTEVLKSEHSEWKSMTKAQLAAAYFGCIMVALERSIMNLAPLMRAANQLAEAAEEVDDSASARREELEAKFTSLDAQIQKQIGQTVEPMTFLLSSLMPSISPNILKSKLEMLVGVLLSILQDYQSNSRITRAVLHCFELLLCIPDNQANSNAYWSNQARINALQSLLVYSIDSRPKIRHSAQQFVCRLFHQFAQNAMQMPKQENKKGADAKTAVSVVPKAVQDVFVQFFQRELASFQSARAEGSDSFREALHLCGMLQPIMHLLSPKNVNSVFQALFDLLKSSVSKSGDSKRSKDESSFTVTSSVSLLFVQLMRTVSAFVHPMEIHQSNPFGIDGVADLVCHTQSLSVESVNATKFGAFLSQLIVQLSSVAPHPNDSDSSIAYFHALELVFARLASVDSSAFLTSLANHFSLFSDRLTSSRHDVVKASAFVLTKSVKLIDLNRINPALGGELFPQLLSEFDSLLHFRYKSNFSLIFPIFVSFFSVYPIIQFPALIPLIEKLDQLKAQGQIGMDDVFGSLFLYFGVDRILAILPLNLPTDLKVPSKEQRQANPMIPFGSELVAALNASRSGLLPILKTFVRHSELSYFLSEFLPMAVKLHDLERLCAASGFDTESRAFQMLRDQIWECFAAFCYLPTDCVDSFKNVAKRMGELLSAQPYHYSHASICKALTMLIKKFQQIVEEEEKKREMNSGDENNDDQAEVEKVLNEEESDDEEDSEEEEKMKIANRKKSTANAAGESSKHRYSIAVPPHFVIPQPSVSAENAQESLQVIGQYAKNLLPVLFNLVTFNAAQAHPNTPLEAILDCIQAFASVADPATLNNLFKSALKKLLEASAAAQKKAEERQNSKEIEKERQRAHVLSDIVLALSGSLSGENLVWLYKIVGPQLSDPDAAMQKKAYKILSRLIESHPEWFLQEWRPILDLLGQSQLKLATAATKTRITCLKAVLMRIPLLIEASHDVLQTILPHFTAEILFCCKDPSTRTREQAYAVLIETARKLAAVELAPEKMKVMNLTEEAQSAAQPLLYEYVIIILSGLIGRSQTMQSATVLALASLIYQFRFQFSQTIIQSIFNNVLPLLYTDSREVVKSVLGFSKVAILALHPDVLQANLPELIEGLIRWCDKRRNRFKPKIRKLFEILMRKCDGQTLRKLVPQAHWPLLEHIRKEKEKERKEKAAAWAQRMQDSKGAKANPFVGGGGASAEQREKNRDFENILNQSDSEEEKKTPLQHLKGKQKKQRKPRAEGNFRIQDEDADFMDESVMSKIQTGKFAAQNATPFPNQIKRKEEEVERDQNGRLVLFSPDGKRQAAPAPVDDQLERKSNKRRAEDEEEEEKPEYIKRSKGENAGRAQSKQAYLPLDPNSLNRRQKHSSNRRFEAVINAAKAGAQRAAQVKTNQKHKGINKKQKKHKG